MDNLVNLKNLIDILIEKEIEKKQECLNNWTVSEYSYHYGMETAYRNIKKEICLYLVPD